MAAILIVEADARTRQRLAESLAARFPAARMLAADTGEAALELARRTPPDVTVLDVRLAAEDGFALVAHLREIGGVIVALTADMAPDTLIEAELAGVAGFLRTPADVDRLDAMLRPLLEGPPSV